MCSGLQFSKKYVGKLIHRDVSAVQTPLFTGSPRLFVLDKNSKLKFLVDSGSDVSVLPTKFAPNPDIEVNYKLNAANNSPIKTFGIHELNLDLNLGTSYLWNFVVAEVSTPIIGADFLNFFHLLPDLKLKKLINSANMCSVNCKSGSSNQGSVFLITQVPNSLVNRLIKQFSDIFKPPQYQKNPPHDVVHYIETVGAPINEKSRRLQPKILFEVREEFDSMLSSGICKISNSEWASPLVIIKKNNKLRIAGDYRKLNSKTTPDRYPLPNLQDSTQQLSGKSIFSSIDLVRAFHNIPVFPDDVPKTAVISPVGLYEYNRMPFGLRNAPSTFQRFMNAVLKDLSFIFCYIDDILVFSRDKEEHVTHLHTLFTRLRKFGLSVNLNKCQFFCEQLDFLGHTISESGFKPTAERVEFFKTLTLPITITGLRSVLGIFNFYRRFNKNASALLAPLNDLLKGHTKKNDKTLINWTDNLKNQFENCRKSFIDFTLLHFPVNDAKLILTSDASNTAVGAVLEQVVNNERQPLGFFSKKLEESKLQYSTYDKELYAIYLAIEHFEHFIEGRDITLVTDHKPLLQIFKTKKRIKLERRARQIEYIAQFTNKILHISGVSNIIADRLSRPEINAVNVPKLITTSTLSDAQQTDDELISIKQNGYKDHQITEVFFCDNEELKPVICSFFNNINRPIVPKTLREPLFHQIHNLAHLGLKSTLKLIRSKYFWPLMTTDIKKWCKYCLACQKSKITRHTKSPIGSFPPSDRFEHVHVDLVGPLPISDGFRYLCTFIDRSTLWTEAIPILDISAENVARVFYRNWVARYGVPLRITSDRGPQFRSQLFNELCKLLGTDHISTTSYHPQANGKVERFHRTLKNSLKCQNKTWTESLPSILLGLKVAPKDESGISAAELTLGKQLLLPGEFYSDSKRIEDNFDFVSQLRKTFQNIRPKTQEYSNKNFFIPKDLMSCKRVFIRIDRVKTPLEAPYAGPYTVIKRAKKYFTIEINGKVDTVSIDRLKPAYELNVEADNSPKPEIQHEKTLVSSKPRPSFYVHLPFHTEPVVSTPTRNAERTDQKERVPTELAPQGTQANVPKTIEKKVRFADVTYSSRGRQIKTPVRFS